MPSNSLQLIRQVRISLTQLIHIVVHVFIDQIDIVDHVRLLLGNLFLKLTQFIDGLL